MNTNITQPLNVQFQILKIFIVFRSEYLKIFWMLIWFISLNNIVKYIAIINLGKEIFIFYTLGLHINVHFGQNRWKHLSGFNLFCNILLQIYEKYQCTCICSCFTQEFP